jgi:hypothetical protein
MALAKKILLMDQHNSIDFASLQTVVLWESNTIQNAKFRRPAFFPYKVWTAIAFQLSFSWFPVQTIMLLRRYLEVGHNSGSLDTDIRTLFFNARFYDATDLRDKIFGLLSIVQFNLRPDYNKLTRQVYCAFTKE